MVFRIEEGQTIQWPKEKGKTDEQRSTQVLIGVFGVQILNSSSKILYSKFTKIFSYDLLVNDHDLHLIFYANLCRLKLQTVKIRERTPKWQSKQCSIYILLMMSNLEDIFIVIYSIKSIWEIKSCLLLYFFL